MTDTLVRTCFQARFNPQAWVNDYAIDVDPQGPTTWDATDAVACTEVQVCRIPRVLIDELSAAHPELSIDLMKRWQRALDDADEWLTELARGPARHRMLRLLLKLSEYAGEADNIWLPTRQEMGAMLDMTFETASRLVSALRREGVRNLPAAAGEAVHVAVAYLPHAEPAALAAYCARTMAHYMVPRYFHTWEGAVPRTGSGKLDRPKIIAVAKAAAKAA